MARSDTLGVIVVSSDPRGVFTEGIINGTDKPGTVMEVETPLFTGSRHKWRAYQPGTDGQRRLIAVLREDDLQGKTINDAYVTGTRCFLYIPAAGEEVLMRIQDIAGTADDHTAGELLIVKSGTGKLIANTGTPESIPFRLLETITDPTADTLALCMRTGY